MTNVSRSNTTAKPQGILHKAFDVVVVLKGLNGLAEIATGLALLILQADQIMAWVNRLTQAELLEDPNDIFATLLKQWALGFGHDAQIFAGFYLLAHGIVKLLLAILLFLEKTWAFPLALGLFSFLVAFSFYRLSLHWSWPLAAFATFDLITIWLIAREWRAVVRLNPLN